MPRKSRILFLLTISVIAIIAYTTNLMPFGLLTRTTSIDEVATDQEVHMTSTDNSKAGDPFESEIRSFKCPIYFTEDKKTKYCAAFDPKKFSKTQRIPICNLTRRVRLNTNFRGVSAEHYASYLNQDLPCDAEGCADCLLNKPTSSRSCIAFINPVHSILTTKCQA